MKKLILLATLVLGFNTFAQEAYISGLFDVKNAAVGSQPTNNKSAFDGLFKVTMITESNFKLDVKYETFKEIGFRRYSIGAGQRFEFQIGDKTFYASPTVGTSLIKRDWDFYLKSFIINPELSIPITFKITDKWGVELHPEWLMRGDLKERYTKTNAIKSEDFKFSFFAGFTYKISK